MNLQSIFAYGENTIYSKHFEKQNIFADEFTDIAQRVYQHFVLLWSFSRNAGFLCKEADSVDCCQQPKLEQYCNNTTLVIA